MPVPTNKKQLKRAHVTTGETKNQKSKLRGPKLSVFLVFLRFFWFSNRNPKNHMFFLDFRWKTKKNTVLFWFSCSVSGEKPKKPCVFLDFCWKTKKHHVFFWIFVGKPKNPRKNKKSKSFGPLRRVLDFWIFGFVVPSAETKKPKIQKSKTFLRGPKLLDLLVFLGFFFGFPTEIQKITWIFWILGGKPKKHSVFLVFLFGLG